MCGYTSVSFQELERVENGAPVNERQRTSIDGYCCPAHSLLSPISFTSPINDAKYRSVDAATLAIRRHEKREPHVVTRALAYGALLMVPGTEL